MDYVLPGSLFRFDALAGCVSPASLAKLKRIGLVYFLYLFLYSALESTLVFLTHLRFNYTSAQQGRVYLFSGVLMIAMQGGYVRRIPIERQRLGALAGLVTVIPAFLMIGFSYNQWTLYAGLALYAVASALVVPCLTGGSLYPIDRAINGY